MKILSILLIFLSVSVSAAAEKIIEEWECIDKSDYFSQNNPILVVAKVFEGRRSGTIEVAGVTHKSRFRVAGFERRWDFGLSGSSFTYAFIIEPNGSGQYYEFKSDATTKPRLFMKCRQK